ncbi:hypothetical protein [Erythrobacter sp. JK5]|uniref:hypothetical protein n=1 Tax=Erythrobacter sp. JK5 TaxID=2829500 RepID=UPI001BAC292E|nr:hypothetical protein [Erythrobacter sp. JK5]QUL38427.1 hypothetical protein KDC96_03165 [Erythrobacter sp. JK5]
MLKALVLLASAAIGFVVAFSFTASDEIGVEVSERLESDFVNQCAARAQFPPELKPHARSICGCMKAEFDRKGMVLTDAFGSKRSEMQQVTQDCARMYM